jgi:hypothetical protein
MFGRNDHAGTTNAPKAGEMTHDRQPDPAHEDAPEPHDPDIDKASEESFPASDPPSYGAPETGADRD